MNYQDFYGKLLTNMTDRSCTKYPRRGGLEKKKRGIGHLQKKLE